VESSSGIRLSAFFDVGNVFGDYNTFSTSSLKYSVGLAGLWLSPLGPISVSLGYPLNADKDDDVQNFQFTVGTFF
jgi:outer membrane protein insertion porin family